MQNTASALIDLSALRHNLEVVRRLCPDSRIMAMVKADAYGHGIVPAARALSAADGFAVARLKEALELREAGFRHRLLLLGTLLDDAELGLCSAAEIDVTAHDAGSLTAIAATAALVFGAAGAIEVFCRFESCPLTADSPFAFSISAALRFLPLPP